MSDTPIAFDLTRLITRLRHASPTGIDRVDLAYARRYLSAPGSRFGLVSTALGPRVIERDAALAIVEAVSKGWIEDITAEDDPVYRRLAAALGAADPPTPGTRAPSTGRRSSAAERRRMQIATALRLIPAGGPERLPHGAIYLHTSHLRLDKPRRFDWLYTRADVKPVFFVHDLIPINYPEYGRSGEAERHAIRMATVARHARHVIVNSHEVGARFRAQLARHALGEKSVTAAWLGIEPAFLERDRAPPRFERPVFVICGTIESRKNHLLLLNLWRDLAQRLGPEAPRLVIVGRRGWEAENVFDMLERCSALRDSVHEVVGLSTPGLAQLMRGATALLMPSFVEGYGLPIIEAAASGLPVIASDIPVHREIAGAHAHFLDPLDGPGWRHAVEALGAPASAMRTELASRLARAAPPTWAQHFARVDGVLEGLAAA